MCRDIIADLNQSKMMISGTINVDRQKRQGRSSTPNSSGSAVMPQKTIRKGLQEAVREYFLAPLVSTLPQLAFLTDGPLASSSSVRLEEGLCQMLDIVMAMSDQALLDQGSQGSRKNVWKTTLVKTVTPKRWEHTPFSDIFPMTHGPYEVTQAQDPWAIQGCTESCTAHGSWG